MPILLTILLLADPGTAEAAAEGCAPPAAESRAEVPQPYVSPATPPGRAEFDGSRRFYFDARRKMTAADFDAWLASLGARVVGTDETAAAGAAAAAVVASASFEEVAPVASETAGAGASTAVLAVPPAPALPSLPAAAGELPPEPRPARVVR